MTDVYHSILKLRAIRDFKPDPLAAEDLTAILEAGRWTGSSKNRQDWSFIVITDRDRLQGLAEHGDYTQPVRDSAATIVLVQEPGGNMFDIGRTAQNIMLAARALGVASCPITLHRDAQALRYLGAPDQRVTRYAVALGYPAEGAEPRRYGGRKPADALVHLEQY
ncbi:MAG TPA: nitroreductase family protein [Acidimicrobiia bacterium]|nr:nitroreductase family protein [Acidimicrobiia bacterium]